MIKLIEMLSVGTKSLELARVILECTDILNSLTIFRLQGIDEQCEKFCTRNNDNASVLRMPGDKQNVANT